jgi:hypothetical protein
MCFIFQEITLKATEFQLLSLDDDPKAAAKSIPSFSLKTIIGLLKIPKLLKQFFGYPGQNSRRKCTRSTSIWCNWRTDLSHRRKLYT